MAGRSIPAESREIAYGVWRRSGQNVEATIRELKVKHGLMVTKPTILSWRKKYGWEDRAARAEAEEQRVQDAVESGEATMIADLEKQKKKYEAYFDTLKVGSLDTQATYAYTNLVKTIADLKGKVGAYKATLFVDFMRDLITYLSANDPDGVPVLEKNFDDFISYAKERYGS